MMQYQVLSLPRRWQNQVYKPRHIHRKELILHASIKSHQIDLAILHLLLPLVPYEYQSLARKGKILY